MSVSRGPLHASENALGAGADIIGDRKESMHSFVLIYSFIYGQMIDFIIQLAAAANHANTALLPILPTTSFSFFYSCWTIPRTKCINKKVYNGEAPMN